MIQPPEGTSAALSEGIGSLTLSEDNEAQAEFLNCLSTMPQGKTHQYNLHQAVLGT